MNAKLLPSNCTSLCCGIRFFCSSSKNTIPQILRGRKRKVKRTENGAESAATKIIWEERPSHSVASMLTKENISETQRSLANSAVASEHQIKEEVPFRSSFMNENPCDSTPSTLGITDSCFSSSVPSTAVKSTVCCLAKSSLDAAERVLSTMYSASPAQSEAQEKIPGISEQQVCTSSSTKCSLLPTEEDYRALLLNLLLLRKETLNPILEVIQEERRALTAKIITLDAKVKELELVRQDIRKLLETHTVLDSNSESQASVFLTPHTVVPSSTHKNTATESSNAVKCTASRIETLESTHSRGCAPSLPSSSSLPQNQRETQVGEPLSASFFIKKGRKSLPEVPTFRKGSKKKKKERKNKRIEISKKEQDNVLLNSISDEEEISF